MAVRETLMLRTHRVTARDLRLKFYKRDRLLTWVTHVSTSTSKIRPRDRRFAFGRRSAGAAIRDRRHRDAAAAAHSHAQARRHLRSVRSSRRHRRRAGKSRGAVPPRHAHALAVQLLLEEARPLLLSSMTQDDNAVFSADLSNPDLLVDGKIALRRENIHLQPNASSSGTAPAMSGSSVRNFGDRPVALCG